MAASSNEHAMIRKTIRDFCQSEVAPVAREYDDPDNTEFPWEIFDQAADLGFLGPHFPEEYGGSGLDFTSTVIIHEEFNRADPGIAMAVLSAKFGTEMILKYGTDEQCQEYVRPVLEGDIACGSAITEPGGGSDVASMRTTATKDGDEWVLDGSKTWASTSPVADFMLVLAKTSEEKGYGGITAFIVPTVTDGFKVEKKLEKMGLRASPTAEIAISDARVPEENVVGDVDKGFYQLMDFFNENRVIAAANALGAAIGAFHHSREYAMEREAFGQTINEFQGIQWKLADMATKIETARSTIYRAAREFENDNLGPMLPSIAKYYASEITEEVCSEAIQIHGGYGYSRDYPVEKFYRDSRVQKIVEGTSEIQKNVIYENLDKID